jgi:HK97 family phage major capsid protein
MNFAEKIKALLEEQTGIWNKMQALSTAHETFSPENQTEWDTLNASYEAKAKEVERLKQAEKIEAEQTELAKPQGRAVIADVKDRVEEDPNKGFKGLWDLAFAVKMAANPNAVRDKRLDVIMAQASGQNTLVDSEGGFLVPEEMAKTLMTNTWDEAALASRTLRVPMTTQVWKVNAIQETSRADGSRYGGVRVYRRQQATQYAGSKVTGFAQVKLELEKLTGLAYETDEAVKFASPSMEPILNMLFAREFAFVIDNELVRGDGASQCMGILNSPALVVQAKEAGQPAKTILFENIANMWSRMPARNRKNAVWFINQEIEPQLFTMQVGLGISAALVYMPPGGISGAPYATLFGRPVVPVEQCSALGDVGDIIFADMGEYLYGDEASGINYATSIHLRFDYGEMAYRWTMYNDGQPWWASTITPYKGANTLSPFVTLAARN